MLNIDRITGGWFGLRAGHESGARSSRRRPRRAWGVEALEGRALLSAFLVDRPGDAGIGAGNRGDLWYCIGRADQARGDCTIRFAPGLDGQTIALTGILWIDKPSGALEIRGPGADELAVSGGGLTQVFAVAVGSRVAIDGLTITGGAGLGGGGIDNDGKLALAGCVVSGNTSFGDGGGGIRNSIHGTMSIVASTVAGNRAFVSDGGGIANAGVMTIFRSTISGNASFGGDGGGIESAGVMAVVDSTIGDNQSSSGDGGGIDNTGSLTLADDTVSGNAAGLSGGGLANQAFLGATVAMDNTIVAGDSTLTDPRTADVLDDADYDNSRLVGGYDLVGVGDLGSLSHTLVGVDPQLGPLQDNGGPTWTQALLAGSPAIGAGDPALVPAGAITDQRGFPYARIVRGRLDIGAFEVQSRRRAFPIFPVPLGPAAGSTEVIVGLTIVPASHPHGPAPSTVGTALAPASGSLGGD